MLAMLFCSVWAVLQMFSTAVVEHLDSLSRIAGYFPSVCNIILGKQYCNFVSVRTFPWHQVLATVRVEVRSTGIAEIVKASLLALKLNLFQFLHIFRYCSMKLHALQTMASGQQHSCGSSLDASRTNGTSTEHNLRPFFSHYLMKLINYHSLFFKVNFDTVYTFMHRKGNISLCNENLQQYLLFQAVWLLIEWKNFKSKGCLW